MHAKQGDGSAGRRRPKGYAKWEPRAPTRRVLDAVDRVLDTYREHLPLTIRQIYYALVAAGEIEKTENAYERLCNYMGRARRARLIDFEDIRDDSVVTLITRHYNGVADFADETAQRAQAYRRDRQAGQPQRIELWCEAAGMLPQLARVAAPYSVPVYSAGGFVSLSAVRQIVDRAVDHARPTVLLHVGDFDPSGESIFETLAADASAFVGEDRVLATQRIEAERVALTAVQVRNLRLPTAPPKASDTRAKRWGSDATCQLEALPPDALATLVRNAIERYTNGATLAAVREREREERAELLGLPPGGDDG